MSFLEARPLEFVGKRMGHKQHKKRVQRSAVVFHERTGIGIPLSLSLSLPFVRGWGKGREGLASC